MAAEGCQMSPGAEDPTSELVLGLQLREAARSARPVSLPPAAEDIFSSPDSQPVRQQTRVHQTAKEAAT